MSLRRTLWVFTNGQDVFVPVDTVVDAWEGRYLAVA